MLSNLLKFTLGIFLAIAILLGSGLAAALYFINRTAIPPAKPVFSNDTPAVKPQAPKVSDAKAKTTPKPAASASPSPTATPTESPQPLPPGAYRGVVTWPQGLSLRSEPEQDATRVGGVGVNQKIVILEESQDKAWQKIRLESGEEGWVKAGNTQKVEE
ncbi:MAG: SH3 domain-containing protein [Goleter apudmare HA4340-LM2]|jgi:hypothetical protein|nr:SH3 domain-containing protein [Goleter apudmare HA4340-LM2]